MADVVYDPDTQLYTVVLDSTELRFLTGHMRIAVDVYNEMEMEGTDAHEQTSHCATRILRAISGCTTVGGSN